jgi:S-disulfanyl-L-cysteine oxidoreductase SoxD
MQRHWLFIVPAAMFLAASRDAAGQTKQANKPITPTTRTGVYNAEQAVRGTDVYLGYCKSCHTPETHAGATFRATWNGKQLADLYAYMSQKMPKNDPGSLSAQEYTDVIAYLLKLNRMPAGKTELPADSTALSTIRIVFQPSNSKREK